MAPVLRSRRTTLLLPLLVTHSVAASAASPAGPSPTAYVANSTPSLGRSFMILPPKKFDTQIDAPSYRIPNGPLPTGKVPRMTPSVGRSLLTLLARLLTTHRLAPSHAMFSGRRSAA